MKTTNKSCTRSLTRRTLLQIEIFIICGAVRDEPVGDEPFLPPRIAPHVSAQSIDVPDVEDPDARSSIHIPLPLGSVCLHGSYARKAKSPVEKMSQPLAPDLRRMDVRKTLGVANDRQLWNTRVDALPGAQPVGESPGV